MKWKKLGQVFNPQIWDDGFHREWMNSHAQCTSTLIFDDYVRVYFSSRYPKDENNQSTSITTFLELDRNNLKNILRVANKPILSLGGLGSFDENAIYPTSVIRHENTVRLYYAGWSRCKSVPFNTSIGMAISNDNGVTFKRYSNGPWNLYYAKCLHGRLDKDALIQENIFLGNPCCLQQNIFF